MRTARCGSSSAREHGARVRHRPARRAGRGSRSPRRGSPGCAAWPRRAAPRRRGRRRSCGDSRRAFALDQRTLAVVGGNRHQTVERLGPVRARGGERLGLLHELRAAAVRPPRLERVDRPRRLLVGVAFGARVRDAERDGVLGRRQADRVIAHRRLDADHGLRHVALDARTAGAVGAVTRVRARAARRCPGGTACTARCCPRQLRVLVDVRLVRVVVAAGARRAALQETLALPEADRIVRESPRAAVGPVRRGRGRRAARTRAAA